MGLSKTGSNCLDTPLVIGQRLSLIHIYSEDGYNNRKLPGSLIYDDEDLDEAAKRVLNELTGLKNVKLTQFKAYGSKNRTRNPKDVLWLERFNRLDEKKIEDVYKRQAYSNLFMLR